MKNKVRNIVSIALIVIGLILLFMAFKGKAETKVMQDKLMDKFKTVSESDQVIEDNQQTEEVQEEEQTDHTYDYISMVNPIAILEIPKINLKVVAAEGTEDNIIRYAVGHFEETAMPGDTGNFALAGHRNFDTGEFFLKLDRLANGDEMKVTTLDGTIYTYSVTNSFVVQPQDTYILEESEEPIITLVTCTYDGSERLIVQGALTGKKDKAE